MALDYHPHQKTNLKNHIGNKWKSHITKKHKPQAKSHTCLLTRYNIPKIHPYAKLNFHTKQKLHPTSKVTLTYQFHQLTNTKRHLRNKYSVNKSHPNPKHHHKLKHLSNPRPKYQPHPKNTAASAYRPRHKNNKFHFINNWKPNSITRHIYINNTKSHFYIIPAIFHLFTTTKFIITIYLKTNMQNPKKLHSHGYYFINKLELVICGDIEPNPGRMPNILHTHPTAHIKTTNIYFIPNTIKLQSEYKHIANTFVPILKTTHPLHPQIRTTYLHLHQYIRTQRQSPLIHILYALVITIHPSIDTCNNILTLPQNYHFNTQGNI